MSTHRLHIETRGIYFCTIRCYQLLLLFEESDGYDSVYTLFAYLKKNGCHALALVIMPDYFDVLLYPTNHNLSLNKLVANGKIFMAFDIISKITSLNKKDLLHQLNEGAQKSEAKKGKKHQVFRLSFDARICYNKEMLEQKLD